MDSYGVRRIDPRAMAAAKRVWQEFGPPKSDFSLASVIRHVAGTDPLLSVQARTIFHRYELMNGMASNGGTIEMEVWMPTEARDIMEQTVEMMVKALKKLARDPVRYYAAALIDIYG